jgi:hypothetical protein
MSVRRLGRALAVPMIALVAAALAACGSNASPGVASALGADAPKVTPTPTASADREEALRQFAACMRQHGVDVPDPQPGGGGFRLGGDGQNINRDDPKLRTALEACRSMLPNGGQPPKLNAQQIEQYRQFAQCMRDNGVNVPDPNPDGTLQFGQGRGAGQFDRNDPTFQKALTACRDKLTGVFPSGGPGFRGGGGGGGGNG